MPGSDLPVVEVVKLCFHRVGRSNVPCFDPIYKNTPKNFDPILLGSITAEKTHKMSIVDR